jgi:CHAD domain-containing protein
MVEPHAVNTIAAADADVPSERGAAPPCVPSEPFLLFAHRVLRRELDALASLRPTDGAPPSPDDIHQLRVAARRLRVALRLFRRMLPSQAVTRLRAELKWFARALGDVRDLDVYADNFHAYAARVPAEQHRALDEYEVHLRRERAAARGRLAALFAEPRAAAIFDAATTFLAHGPSAGALRRWRSLSTRDGIRASVRKSLRRVRKRGGALTPTSRPSAFHEVRIRAKRLRYELEFFAEVYPELTPFAKATKALQETLGEHQDAATASERLRRYGQGLGQRTRLPPALDALRRAQLAHARDIRRSFGTVWQRFMAGVADVSRAIR